MGSSRLPGKVMRPILGKSMLELLIIRLRQARLIDQIVVATTINQTDDVIEDLMFQIGITCVRGSEEDVVDRVLQAAHAVNADVIIEITGDCPLIDPALVDQVVGFYLANQFDYVRNVGEGGFPRGLDAQAFSTTVLEEVARSTQDPVHREHPPVYINEHPDRFSIHLMEVDNGDLYRNLRLTVDTPEDFALINAIYQELYPASPAFSFQDILLLLEQRPELVEINRHIQQKSIR